MSKVYVCLVDFPYEGFAAPELVTLDKEQADSWLADIKAKPWSLHTEPTVLEYVLGVKE